MLLTTRMVRFLRPVLLISLAVTFIFVEFNGSFPWSASTTYASGDLTINWGVPEGSPIFSLSNIKPGDTFSRTVSITNTGSFTRQIGIRGTATGDAGESLGSGVVVSISADGIDRYGGTLGTKTMEQLFTESAQAIGIPLLALAPNQTKDLIISAQFLPSAGNEFQAQQITFDLTFGTTIPLPPECTMEFTGSIILGTGGSDKLTGTALNDILVGFEQGDTLSGMGGDDCIVGLEGNDSLIGGDGNDVIAGGTDSDSLSGGNGEDFLDGGMHADTLMGGTGNDTLKGGEYADTMYGNDGDDLLFGDGGPDTIRGGNGTDTLFGGTANDFLYGEAGADTLHGELNYDTADGGTEMDTCDAEVEILCEW